MRIGPVISSVIQRYAGFSMQPPEPARNADQD